MKNTSCEYPDAPRYPALFVVVKPVRQLLPVKLYSAVTVVPSSVKRKKISGRVNKVTPAANVVKLNAVKVDHFASANRSLYRYRECALAPSLHPTPMPA